LTRISKLAALPVGLGILALAVGAASGAPADPVDWVNLYIGSGSGPIGYGQMMTSVVTPFGMTSWTPQTRQNKISRVSYKYEDTAITGFMGTHQPALWMGDYGYVTLMPEIGELKTTPEARRLPFTHSDEIARPDYYSVSMDAGGGRRIRTEMTATTRAAYLRFTFPAHADAKVIVEASRPGHAGFAQVDPARHEISGYNPDRMDAHLGPDALPNFKGYFVIRYRQAFTGSGLYGQGLDQAHGAYVRFDPAPGEAIEAKVGTSFISLDQARRNLDAEIPDWSFDKVRRGLRAEWNAKLKVMDIEGASDDQRHIFYTALYHTMLYPRQFSEQGRYYSAFDDQVHTGVSYTAYSIWDIFRAEYSMLTLTSPGRAGEMIQALLQDYKEGGWMPKWPNPSYTNIMIGTHADSMVAEALTKNLGGFDRKLAWDAVYKDAMTPPDGDTTRRWADREPHTPYEARAGLTYLKQLGYIPADRTAESASSTLEDSYDDFAVATVAKTLGREGDYRFFLKRSLNYKNIYNPATGMMQARNFDGGWADPEAGWTEDWPQIYTWSVMHDIPGLTALMGGRQAFDARLDAYFADDWNSHSNEPSHHVGYLYDYAGQPWKTQAKVREIAADEYANKVSGLDGDDDCGQMSAWYVFTALGFYPVNPASGDYMIGSPLFSRAVIHLANGKSFTVTARNSSEQNMYIQSATLNGRPLDAPVLHYADIMSGARLDFVMGPKPSDWGAGWKPEPLSAVIERMAPDASVRAGGL
jgi:predicted alpha-1,2-mannosidase